MAFLKTLPVLNDMNVTDHHKPLNRWHVKTRHSVRTKFLVAFASVFTVTFFASGFIVTYGLPYGSIGGWQGNAKQEAMRSLNAIADLQKARLLTWIRERLGDAQMIAESQIVRTNMGALSASTGIIGPGDRNGNEPRIGSDDKGARSQIVNLISSIQQLHANNRTANYRVIRIVDANLEWVLASTSAGESGSRFDDAEILRKAIRRRESYVSDVSVGEQGLVANFVVGYPVFDAKRSVTGIVVLEVAIKDSVSILRSDSIGLGETGETLLINEDSTILTALRHPLRDGSQAEILVYKITAKPALLAVSGHEGMIESEDYRGHEVIAAYRHIRVSPDWGWGLVVKVDQAQLFASINEATRLSKWIGTIGIILIVILSFILTHQLTAPLARITRAAARFAAGDRFEPSQLKSRDEIGLLSSVFDDMVETLDSTNRNLSHRSAELDAANKELESFAYAVAHDLRAPLRAIDGFSQALVEHFEGRLEGEAANYLRYLREGSQEMGQLIDDLLKLSRSTRGEMHREDVDLSSMAAEILEALKSGEPDRNVKTDMMPGIVVSGDPRLLRVVMDNLLGNAWKFSAEEPEAHIEFGAERLNGKLRCVIRDNGVGFDMAYSSKLFVPFQRLHRNEEFQGTGIGLVTVQRIIHRHGGTIRAIGSVGGGASFSFELDAGEKDHG